MTAKHKPSQARQPKVLPPADETLLQKPSKTEALAGPTAGLQEMKLMGSVNLLLLWKVSLPSSQPVYSFVRFCFITKVLFLIHNGLCPWDIMGLTMPWCWGILFLIYIWKLDCRVLHSLTLQKTLSSIIQRPGYPAWLHQSPAPFTHNGPMTAA